MPHNTTPFDTEADEAHDVYAPAVQHGVDDGLSGRRSRVRIPIGALKVNDMERITNKENVAAAAV